MRLLLADKRKLRLFTVPPSPDSPGFFLINSLGGAGSASDVVTRWFFLRPFYIICSYIGTGTKAVPDTGNNNRVEGEQGIFYILPHNRAQDATRIRIVFCLQGHGKAFVG